MPFPVILIPVAVSAVRSLIRYRIRVDHILAVKKTSDALPFTLPPLPKVNFEDTPAMAKYFQSEQGQLLLDAANLSEVFADFQSGGRRRNMKKTTDLLKLYYRTTGGRSSSTGRSSGPGFSPNAEKALAYYMVNSYRLSTSSATTRILLATADILMEFAGDNAAIFISNPKTASIVTTLLREFAARHDFNEQSLDNVYKKLLGSAVVAALDNKESLPEHPALLVLYSALGDVRQQLEANGDDFVARIISAGGFQRVVSSYLTKPVTDPAFLEMLAHLTGTDKLHEAERRLIREAFGATLITLGRDLPEIIEDPVKLTGVLEAAINSAAANASGVIRVLGDEQPLLKVVLHSVAAEVARRKDLFDTLASGELLGAIYKTSLATIAADPKTMINQLEVNGAVQKIVIRLAEELSRNSLKTTLERLKDEKGLPLVSQLISRSILVLGEYPKVLTSNNVFASAVMGSALNAGADLVRDGLQVEDLMEVIREGIKSAASNIEFAKMNEPLRTLLTAVGASVSKGDLRTKLATPEIRRDVLLQMIRSVASNPKVWNDFGGKDIAQPLVTGILDGLTKDANHLLSGDATVEAFKQSLRAVSRRGNLLLQQGNVYDEVEAVLVKALEAADHEIGRTMTGEDIPDFLGRVLFTFFKDSLTLATAAGREKFEEARARAIVELERRL
ncbi:MAG: hypothetical protein GTO40_06280 [Deltaproteobacteria bacterium]|nr:hypothetical protein [Deltaproteobacteria bacterium]